MLVEEYCLVYSKRNDFATTASSSTLVCLIYIDLFRNLGLCLDVAMWRVRVSE